MSLLVLARDYDFIRNNLNNPVNCRQQRDIEILFCLVDISINFHTLLFRKETFCLICILLVYKCIWGSLLNWWWLLLGSLVSSITYLTSVHSYISVRVMIFGVFFFFYLNITTYFVAYTIVNLGFVFFYYQTP
jgi:hypothetical protein